MERKFGTILITDTKKYSKFAVNVKTEQKISNVSSSNKIVQFFKYFVDIFITNMIILDIDNISYLKDQVSCNYKIMSLETWKSLKWGKILVKV